MTCNRHLRVLGLALALCWLYAGEGLAQGDTSQAVLSATLADVHSGLRKSGDARIDGPVAFDPRVLRAPRGPAPAGWPDSLTLKWVGDSRNAALPPATVTSVLAGVNGSQTPLRWLPCDSAPGSRRCVLTEFPAVVAVSEPWISGDVAQVLVLGWYRSSIALHPYAFFVNVVRLRRVGGQWRVTHGHNQAGNWRSLVLELPARRARS